MIITSCPRQYCHVHQECSQSVHHIPLPDTILLCAQDGPKMDTNFQCSSPCEKKNHLVHSHPMQVHFCQFSSKKPGTI